MQAQIHCPCGFSQPIKPGSVAPRLRCTGCGMELIFSQDGKEHILWLHVGGKSGPPVFSAPIPRGIKLYIGSAADNWLILAGDDITPKHTELMLTEDHRLCIRHTAKSGATWINRASILQGVLHEKDSLLIGEHCLRLRSQGAVVEKPAPEPRNVILTETDEESSSQMDEDSDVIDYSDSQSPRQKLKRNISIGLICITVGYLIWWYWVAPNYSKEMPAQTFFRCPVDGTIFRAEWRSGATKCPQCGALCFGNLRYKSEKNENAPTAAQPASAPAVKKGAGS